MFWKNTGKTRKTVLGLGGYSGKYNKVFSFRYSSFYTAGAPTATPTGAPTASPTASPTTTPNLYYAHRCLSTSSVWSHIHKPHGKPRTAPENAAMNTQNTGLLSSIKNLLRISGPKAARKTSMDLHEVRNPYIQYPTVTHDQMRRLASDGYKLDVGYAAFAHHSTLSSPTVHSLSDLTDPTQLNSLLPRRRPHGSPTDTLSIKAGDDAMLVAPTVLAVADGVSGWNATNAPGSSGIFARSMLETISRLMTEYKLGHMPHRLNGRDVKQILDDSFLHTSHLMDLQRLQGSSTLVLGMLNGESLQYISIGDSRLYVVRDGAIVHTNEEQMLGGLCPQQIGTQTLSRLPSEFALVEEVSLREHDVIVVCSDGVSDNLFSWELTQALARHLKSPTDSVRTACTKILAQCKSVALDDNAYTPYNVKINEMSSGRFGNSLGGKMDDMSLCVARVVSNSSAEDV
ncbi:hypothetical protein JCM33374_g1014 [Metschnikowia sp. JCM 33374]|nr:hypothetical protein JCM33374_g1014 [Metschnikowia sp. JCM 33374]